MVKINLNRSVAFESKIQQPDMNAKEKVKVETRMYDAIAPEPGDAVEEISDCDFPF